MKRTKEKLEEYLKIIKEKTDFVPKVGLVLGSGLGKLAEELDIVATIDYKELPDFPVSTVSGHKGRYIFAYIDEVPVVLMQGRVHLYEGYNVNEVVLPTRLMIKMGIEILFLTNAAGGISKELQAGDFMLIKDHISSFIQSPLIGENVDEWGDRFPSMFNVYDFELQDIIKKVANDNNIKIKEGIYLQTTGPQYETPTEVNVFSMLGAHAVGMSTVVEAIAAKHMGIKVCGISCITNMAGGTATKPLSHEEVKEIADKNAPYFKKLVLDTIKEFKEIV